MDGTTLRVQVPMRWGDMDAYGHVNNVNLIRLMEEARIAGFGVPGGTGAPGAQPQAAPQPVILPERSLEIVDLSAKVKH